MSTRHLHTTDIQSVWSNLNCFGLLSGPLPNHFGPEKIWTIESSSKPNVK